MSFQKLNINLDDTGIALQFQKFQQVQEYQNQLKLQRQHRLDTKLARNAERKESYLQEVKMQQLERQVNAYNRSQHLAERKSLLEDQLRQKRAELQDRIHSKKCQMFDFEREKEQKIIHKKAQNQGYEQMYQMRLVSAREIASQKASETARRLATDVVQTLRFARLKSQKIQICDSSERVEFDLMRGNFAGIQ
ncbi:hypothetical protein SS50377_27177 [Spironucleus salmonicida]|uniref:Uncharacterized protein n=1 Tax=Spironucleus salmonicida TaxID=348837 RepID=V6LWL8_9EUKA|nr:hypothetical protein SS50377_27177 [Spironucleus salmonicida]|eukprot:EST48975.1 Hypothetical protein SS50377_10825 [Spironucleus salmonicida]